MQWKALTAAAVAVLGLAISENITLAQEFQRLVYTPDQPIPASGISAGVATMTLQMNADDEEADTVLTHGRGWGGYRGYGYGGYRGYGYSGYRGWGGYGWGGYRGYGYSYYRPYYPNVAFNFGYYRPYVPYYNYYYPPQIYYYGPSCYYYPIASDGAAPTYSQAIVKVEPTRIHGQANGGIVQIAPPAAPHNGTYYYDGGPQAPVPLPKPGVETKPAPAAPSKTIPLEGLPVSLPPKNQAKYVYPAYGEKPVQTSFAEDRVIAVKK